jgi:DNA-directed RNA polymerase alpha subunit
VNKGEKGLMTLRNFGVKSLQELADRLNELGITLIQSGEILTDSTTEEAETESDSN